MFTPVRPSRITALALLLPFLLLPASPATARSGQAADYFTYSNCPLERIGTQLVRCDILTGTGADAPYWIPEQK
jgi:hypothetical protein